MGGGTNQATES